LFPFAEKEDFFFEKKKQKSSVTFGRCELDGVLFLF